MIVRPGNLLTTPIQQDPFDPTIFTFLATFTADADQIGQNLFCFAAIDSIGNQGDSACLRFTVSSDISSLQPLYIQNATRYPMGTVAKNTSLWTIYTDGRIYVRPTIETYIRFKRASDNSDYYVLNVMTATENVLFYNDRIVINSSVVWTPGGHFYIYFDAGVFIEASTCTKEAMPINDPTFWPFDIPGEMTESSTTSTTTTTVLITTTTRLRTIPTRQTPATLTTTTSVSTSTTTSVQTTLSTTSATIVQKPFHLSISAIVGIALGCLGVCTLLLWLLLSYIHNNSQRSITVKSNTRLKSSFNLLTTKSLLSSHSTKMLNSSSLVQYKIATRSRGHGGTNKCNIAMNVASFRENLVEVQV